MNAPEAVKLAEDVAGMAEQLRHELVSERRPRRDVFQDIHALRRSVELLEREVRDAEPDTVGEAC